MARRLRGSRVVVLLFLVVVGVAGAFGYLVGLIDPADLRPVPVLGVWTVQPTPAGLALYGAVTVGTALGVGLVLVALVSRYADDERPA